jgi:hypothetical protein
MRSNLIQKELSLSQNEQILPQQIHNPEQSLTYIYVIHSDITRRVLQQDN